MQSGLCRTVLSKTENIGTFPSAHALGIVTATALGCTSGDIASCLRNAPVANVLAAQNNFAASLDLGIGVGPTLPVVDGVVLDKRPMVAIREGRGAVPLIVGSNRDDSSAFVSTTNQPGAFASYLDSVGQTTRKTELLALYPPATLGEREAAIAFSTDLAFACPAQALANVRQQTSYLYELTRAIPNGPVARLGAAHGFDFLYLFNSFASFGVTPQPEDNTIATLFQKGWGALAHGNPPTNVATPAWPAMPAHLQIDSPLASVGIWRGGRCEQLQQLGLLSE
jgi:para-nitrobenzyl esterase